MDHRADHGRRRRTKDTQSCNSLARDYSSWIGSKGSLIKRWCTDGLLGGKLTSIGNDRDGSITITSAGGLQAYSVEGRLEIPTLGKTGPSPGKLMQPCQTALSADLAVMAVADSGNNRIQLFDTSTWKLLASVGRKGQIRPGRMQRPEGVAFVDGRPEMIVADTGNDRLQVFHIDEIAVRPDPAAQGTIGGVNNGSGSDDEREGSRPCLLVFEGCREADKLRKRRTAGESDTAEGPLAQPCDVAYWRGTPTGGGRGQGEEQAHGATTGNPAVTAWKPRLPEWFLPHRSGPRPSGLTGIEEDREKERARRELLLPASPPGCNSTSQVQVSAVAVGAGASGGGVVEGGTPRYGSFLVRETGLRGKLRLLFVAKTQEAEEAEKHQADDADDDTVSDLSGGDLGETESEGDLGWMKPAKRRDGRSRTSTGGNGQERHRGSDRERGGEKSDASSQDAPSTPTPAFEICDEEVTVLDGGRGVEVCGRVYGSLLSLLRAFRGRGFERLVGVTDTRGARGLVAVAERAGGRVRLLHYAPAFPPFYTTELTHLHRHSPDQGVVKLIDMRRQSISCCDVPTAYVVLALRPYTRRFKVATTYRHYSWQEFDGHRIEGLQRPSSVSFNDAGDLLVVDRGSNKVVVYSHLSGRWIVLREFGPTSTSSCFQECEGNRLGDCNRTSESTIGPAPVAAKRRDEETRIHDGKHARRHGTGVEEVSSEEYKDEDSKPVTNAAAADATSVGREHYRRDSATPPPCRRARSGLAERKNDWMHDPLDWATGTGLISARFVRFKTRRLSCTPAELDSEADDCREVSSGLSAAIVVGAMDGVVRILRGPKGRHCGSFACLAEDTALDIVELLGYKPSQVLGHVNRTMAGLRSKLRREWRLYPLTPGDLARRKVEFLRWGRLVTGEGLPGRGVIADAQGKQLCDRFLATSACARPACPYSHHQPMIHLGSEDADVCIVFRGGVTHAVNNLYGQIFGWEWEGDLHRLFGERSVVRAIVTRHDPMTLGMNGAEVIRQCTIEEDSVLDYASYVDFVTVVHEQAIKLRSWHRPFPSLTAEGQSATSASGGENSVATVPPPASAGPKVERRSFLGGEDSGGSGVCGRAEPDAATPWLGWDFAALHGDKGSGANVSSVKGGGDGYDGRTARANPIPGIKGCHTPPTAAGDKRVTVHSERKGSIEVETQSKRAQNDEEDFDSSSGNSVDDDQGARERDDREEQKMNRAYGTTAEERAASANQVVAFQTDRVVRMLDRMFE